MTVLVPYQTSGQELGETRTAMTKTLMRDLEKVIDKYSDREGMYYILVHAKPVQQLNGAIIIKIVPMNVKPPMMLSCLLFGVDNESGKLTLEWALPGDWPTWSVGGKNTPVPETIASISKSGITYHYDSLLPR